MKTGIVTMAIALAALTACNEPQVACSCAPSMFSLTVKPLGSCDSARLANLVLLVHRDNRTDTVAAEQHTLCTSLFPIYASLDTRSVDLVDSAQVIASYPVQSTLIESDGCCGNYVMSEARIPGGVDTAKGLVVGR